MEVFKIMSLTVNLSEYTKFWEVNNYSFIWHDIYVYSVYKNHLIEKILGVQEKNLLCRCENGTYSFYLKNIEIEKNKRQVLEFFISSSYDKLANSIEQVLAEAEQLPAVEYNDWKEKFEWLSKKHTEAASLYFCIEAYYVDNICDHLISLGYEEKDILQYAGPLKMPKLIEELLEWYDLIVNKSYDKDINLFIENHFNKWKNIIAIAQTHMEPYTIDVLRKRYEENIKNINKVKYEYQELKNNYSPENIEKRITDSKNIFNNEDYLVRRVSEISYLRFELRLVWMRTRSLLITLLKEVFPKNEHVFECSANEILDDDVSGCDDRKSFTYYADEQNSLLSYNNTQFIDIIDEDCQENSNEVYGKISFGIDSYGEAYVLENNGCLIDAQKFVNKNTILILPQLCPEHFLLLNICKGIVVNEGGYAGHATIMARETKKSAIIGTINGTRRIKNGEYIHLDIASKCVRKICND